MLREENNQTSLQIDLAKDCSTTINNSALCTHTYTHPIHTHTQNISSSFCCTLTAPDWIHEFLKFFPQSGRIWGKKSWRNYEFEMCATRGADRCECSSSRSRGNRRGEKACQGRPPMCKALKRDRFCARPLKGWGRPLIGWRSFCSGSYYII
jgi:hypothetical protein